MVNAFDRAMGTVERTSAEVGDGAWMPGMPTLMGFFWAGTIEGERYAAFETAPGNVLLTLNKENLLGVRKVAAGINVVVEVNIPGNDGAPDLLTFIGPNGRMKKIFAHMGFAL